jgi:hypothetical protein
MCLPYSCLQTVKVSVKSKFFFHPFIQTLKNFKIITLKVWCIIIFSNLFFPILVLLCSCFLKFVFWCCINFYIMCVGISLFNFSINFWRFFLISFNRKIVSLISKFKILYWNCEMVCCILLCSLELLSKNFYIHLIVL